MVRLDECELNYRGHILSKLEGSAYWHYPKVHTEKQQFAVSFIFPYPSDSVRIPTILRKYKFFQRFTLKYISELIIHFNHSTLKITFL